MKKNGKTNDKTIAAHTAMEEVTESLPPLSGSNRIERDPSDPSRVRIDAEFHYKANDYTDKNRPHTRGEKWFNIIVHLFLDYVVNTILSIVLTHWASTKQKKHYDAFKGWMVDKSKKARSVLGMKKDDEAAKEFGHYFADLFSLAMVGHFLLIPIKMLKDKEAKIVSWIDEKLDRGRRLSDQEKAYREMAYAAIEQKPKQTVGRVILSRIGALALNWGILTGVVNKVILKNKKIPFEKKNLQGYTDKVADVITGKFFKGNQSDTVRSITKLTVYELLSCAITAIGLKKVMTAIEKVIGKRDKGKNGEKSVANQPDKKDIRTQSGEYFGNAYDNNNPAADKVLSYVSKLRNAGDVEIALS